MAKFYCEKKLFGKKVCRPIVESTEEMLNCSDRDVLLEIRNLDVTYGNGVKRFKAIKDVSFNVYDGEVLGLVGESGSGKSTIGRTLVGLTPHSFGHIKILDTVMPKNVNKGFKFGKNKKKILDFLINKVQMIFQDPTNSLNPYKNVETVVGEGLTNLKAAKFIYLYNYDAEFFVTLNQRIRERNLKPLFEDFEKLAKETPADHKESYQKYFVQTYRELIKATNQDARYQEFIPYFNESIQTRKEMDKLSERACRKKLILQILNLVGLDDSVLGRYPLEFSGGQQQRLGICRAVVLQPKLLIADEPISALDVSIQAQVINIFNELKEKFNLTIVFIAHDLRMVEYISDRIAILNKGVLVEIGPTNEIMKHPMHPYTKSLLDAVPSIDSEKGSLLGYIYNPEMHEYDMETQPKWQDLGNQHFVLATDEELETFKELQKQNFKEI
ncbi:ABC transporter ATP-binding protein [Mycoplasmopsis columbinasalis]|uniref:Phosphate ABC transporter ATP-binding protein n=1 Tax=Mycoplasmopsis columbinasalis TaxID=114880 RepID=A0A449BAH8_9BACT|nr:ABC transporter ATP-binding protein [Mycoplasmopsis columbinasalis]VEU78203.1 phosphate ABC transporter ATP-binding protein [Mycoplasmopsis columbinasalis]